MMTISDKSARQMLDAARGVAVLVDEDGIVLFASDALRQVLGTSPEQLAGSHLEDFVHPDDLKVVNDLMLITESSYGSLYPVRVRMRGDAEVWAEVDVSSAGRHDVDDQTGFLLSLAPIPAAFVYDDVLDSIVGGASLERVLTTVADSVNGPWSSLWASIHYAEDNGRFQKVITTAGRETFRRSIDTALQADDFCLWDPVSDNEERTFASRDFSDGIALASKHAGLAAARIIPCATGTWDAVNLVVWFENTFEMDEPAFQVRIDQLCRMIGLAMQREASDARIRWGATHDPLTGLANRSAFFRQLADNGAKPGAAVVHVDIDSFGAINDWHGQSGGDAVLMQVAERLREAVRPGDLVARLGGDEFAILCADVRPESCPALAERILQSLEQTLLVKGERVDVAASVGIAMAEPGRTAENLSIAAAAAMHDVKQNAPGSFGIA